MISSGMQFTICDVCRLLDYDTEKKLCGYCGLCDAFICNDCSNRWDRRLKAAIKRKLEPGFKGDPSYTNKIDERGMLREPSADTRTNA